MLVVTDDLHPMGTCQTSVGEACHLQKTHAFAVSPGSHALRTYPDDAGAALATSGPTLRGYAARNPGVRWRLWGHLKNEGIHEECASWQYAVIHSKRLVSFSLVYS